MPRKPKFNLAGIPQHVIQRGNNQEPYFYAEEDYRHYLDNLNNRKVFPQIIKTGSDTELFTGS